METETLHEAHGTVQSGGLEHKKIKTVKKERTTKSQSSTQNPTPSKKTKTTHSTPNTKLEYTYHKGTPFAKEKEEKEILCPQVVSQGPVFKQKEQIASKTFAQYEYSS